jgi:hypothetical protein
LILPTALCGGRQTNNGVMCCFLVIIAKINCDEQRKGLFFGETNKSPIYQLIFFIRFSFHARAADRPRRRGRRPFA